MSCETDGAAKKRKNMTMRLVTCALFLLVSAGAAGGEHVLLSAPGDNVGYCGGSLISPEWVLTAAHCNMTDLEVILGQKERIKVTDRIPYREGSVLHNIMLLRMQKKPTSRFTPTKLAAENCKKPDKNANAEFHAWIIGNVDLKKHAFKPPKLQTGTLKVSDCAAVPDVEKQPIQHKLEHNKHKLLCTKHSQDVKNCELYAGASVIYNKALYGVLVNYDFHCKKQVEFMDICYYRKWIKTTAKV